MSGGGGGEKKRKARREGVRGKMTEKGDLRRHFLSSLPPPSLPPLFFFSRSILRIFCISSLLSVRHREGGCGRKGGLGEKQCEAIAMESNGGGVYNTSPLSPGVNKRWGRREGQSFPILLSGLLPFAVARWLVGWLVGVGEEKRVVVNYTGPLFFHPSTAPCN